MKKRFITIVIALGIAFLFTVPAFGLDQIVEKKVFFLREFTLVSGEKILPVMVGYETYGTLSPSKDNVILICHYYSSNSHAAGKYSPSDKTPGYWDAIIGPGKEERDVVGQLDLLSQISYAMERKRGTLLVSLTY